MQSALNAPHLCNEEAAIAYVEARLWPDGPICPHCGTIAQATKMKGKTTRPGLWNCRPCRKPFTVRMRTIFESSHVPMHIWLQAIYLICSSKKGISTRQIQRTLGGSMKTAWFLMHRIRLAMNENGSGPLGGEGKIVEADETYFGTREGYKREPDQWELTPQGWRNVADRRRNRGHKNIIVTLVVVTENADKDSALMTDELIAYRRIGRQFASHETVNHGTEEYVRGRAHVNTAENYFSIFKRGMIGIYQHCNERHLHRYAAEFDFRYSNRIALGVDDEARTRRAVVGAKGKRLTYQTTRSQEALDTPPF
jgi:transposase-like protein